MTHSRYSWYSRCVSVALLSLGIAFAAPVAAQISVNIVLAPPAPLYEPEPVMPRGHVWAPGYWAWHGDRHIWVRGRTLVERPGYRWEPDRWEPRGNGYYRNAGRWERDAGYKPVKMKKEKKQKKAKKDNGGKRDD